MKLHFLPALLFAAVAASAQNTPPIHVTVDVTDAPRKILHAFLTIPVQPGPLTLLYPEWIPGEHCPTARSTTSPAFSYRERPRWRGVATTSICMRST